MTKKQDPKKSGNGNSKFKSLFRHFKPVKRYSGASGSGNTLVMIEAAMRRHERRRLEIEQRNRQQRLDFEDSSTATSKG